MKLIVAHQILIGSAIALALLFGTRALVLAARGGDATNAAIGAVSLLVAAALGLYFRKVRARYLASKTSGGR
jgi:hypothetical protein